MHASFKDILVTATRLHVCLFGRVQLITFNTNLPCDNVPIDQTKR